MDSDGCVSKVLGMSLQDSFGAPSNTFYIGNSTGGMTTILSKDILLIDILIMWWEVLSVQNLP